MKFLCDQMLGTLAKWLRICGLDTYYAKREMDDKELLDISKKENRVLITKDKELIYNARREQIDVIKIQTNNLDKQIKKVLKSTKIKKNLTLTRCLICNTKLSDIDKKEVKNKIPSKVFENHTKFLFCEKCKKIYWKGTHYLKMIEKIKKLRD